MAIRDNLGGGSSGAVLDTLEEIAANTESGKAAGALAVKELNDSLETLGEWTLVGTVTGTTPINIPSNAKEYLIAVTHRSNLFKKTLERFLITDEVTVLQLGGGYSQNSYGSICNVYINTESIYIRSANIDTTEGNKTAKLSVYYR